MVAFIITIIETILFILFIAWIWVTYSTVSELKSSTNTVTDVLNAFGEPSGEAEAESWAWAADWGYEIVASWLLGFAITFTIIAVLYIAMIILIYKYRDGVPQQPLRAIQPIYA